MYGAVTGAAVVLEVCTAPEGLPVHSLLVPLPRAEPSKTDRHGGECLPFPAGLEAGSLAGLNRPSWNSGSAVF